MSLSYKIVEKICFAINKLPSGGAKGLMMKDFSGSVENDALPRYMYRRGLKIEESDIDGFYLYRLKSTSYPGKTDKAVLFLPGGGGMARATKLHYDTATRIAKRTGADVYIAAYPLAPRYNVRDALSWLEKVYSGMTDKYDPGNIILIGDSAGANLILSLTNRLGSRPGKLIVISPACGLEYGKNRDIRLQMEPYDPILNVAMNDVIAENWCRDVNLDSPDISPEYVDYTDFPPMYFFYGEHEIFYPLVKNFIGSLREKNISFEETVRPMCHDWALCGFFPEGREAVTRMCKIITERGYEEC